MPASCMVMDSAMGYLQMQRSTHMHNMSVTRRCSADQSHTLFSLRLPMPPPEGIPFSYGTTVLPSILSSAERTPLTSSIRGVLSAQRTDQHLTVHGQESSEYHSKLVQALMWTLGVTGQEVQRPAFDRAFTSLDITCRKRIARPGFKSGEASS